MITRQCLRRDGTPKVVYLTKQEAKKKLREVPGDTSTGWNSWYKCGSCGYYHIGREMG